VIPAITASSSGVSTPFWSGDQLGLTHTCWVKRGLCGTWTPGGSGLEGRLVDHKLALAASLGE